jgi:hypothetical protein
MPAPVIITRAQWGAAPPTKPLQAWADGQPTGWVVHWAGAPVPVHDHSSCAADVRADQRYHQTHGYSDGAYSYLVCQHGSVYEMRGAAHRSAAQGPGNSRYLAVQYHGGPGTPFTAPARNAIRDLISRGPAGARSTVITHREVPGCATACPGDQISRWVAGGMITGSTSSPQPAPARQRPVLRRGDRSSAVSELQQVLNRALRAGLTVDGIFGPATEAAVRLYQRWQTDHGLPLAQDGIVGPATWAALAQHAG